MFLGQNSTRIALVPKVERELLKLRQDVLLEAKVVRNRLPLAISKKPTMALIVETVV